MSDSEEDRWWEHDPEGLQKKLELLGKKDKTDAEIRYMYSLDRDGSPEKSARAFEATGKNFNKPMKKGLDKSKNLEKVFKEFKEKIITDTSKIDMQTQMDLFNDNFKS